MSNINDSARLTLSKLNHNAPLKSTIIDTDEFSGQDSANSNTLIRITSSTVYAYLKPKFDVLYATSNVISNAENISFKYNIIDTDQFFGYDSANNYALIKYSSGAIFNYLKPKFDVYYSIANTVGYSAVANVKSSLISTDSIFGYDSANSNNIIKFTTNTLYSYLKNNFDTVYSTTNIIGYSAITNTKSTIVNNDYILGYDSANSNNITKFTANTVYAYLKPKFDALYATSNVIINAGNFSLKYNILDTDQFFGYDSANSNSIIRITSSTVYNYLKPKFDVLYATSNVISNAENLSLKYNIIDNDQFFGYDSANNYALIKYSSNSIYNYLKPKFDVYYSIANTIGYSAVANVKSSLVNTDTLFGYDSANSNNIIKFTANTVYNYLQPRFDILYSVANTIGYPSITNVKSSLISTDSILGYDSANSNNITKFTANTVYAYLQPRFDILYSTANVVSRTAIVNTKISLLANDEFFAYDSNSNYSQARFTANTLYNYLQPRFDILYSTSNVINYSAITNVKSSLINTDSILGYDSANSNNITKFTSNTLYNYLKPKFDVYYSTSNVINYTAITNVKSSLINTDSILGYDSANSNNITKFTSNTLYNYLKPKFDVYYSTSNVINYSAITNVKSTIVNNDSILGYDSANSNNITKFTANTLYNYLKPKFDVYYSTSNVINYSAITNVKSTIVNNDSILGYDSANSNNITKFTSNTLYTYLKNRFDNVYTNSANIYFKPVLTNATTVSRTVANTLLDVLSVKDFGAIGDGVTDDSAAIQTAFQYGANNNVQIYVPSGNYLLNSQVNVTLSNTAAANDRLITVGTNRKFFNVLGDGQFCSTFVVGPNNANGAIKVYISTSTFDLEIKQIGIASQIDQTIPNHANNGIALLITSILMDNQSIYWNPPYTIKGGSNPTTSVIIDNIFIGGYHALPNFLSKGVWTKGIHLQNIWTPTISNCTINGMADINEGFAYEAGDILTFDIDAFKSTSLYTPGLETGSGFTLSIDKVDTNGRIVSYSTASGSIGYTPGTYLSIPMKYVSGSANGYGAFFTVMYRPESVQNNYYNINSKGTGYSNTDILVFDLDAYAISSSYTPGLETGSGFSLAVNSVTAGTKAVSTISVNTSGSGYTPNTYLNVPMKYAANGNGSGFTLDVGYLSDSYSWYSLDPLTAYPNPSYVEWNRGNSGPNMPTGNTVAGIHLEGCYGPFLNHIAVQGYFDYGCFQQGVVTQGNNEQGGWMLDCAFVNQRIGFAIDHRNTSPPNPAHIGFQITQCHFNSQNYGLYINNHIQVFITNCYFFVASPFKTSLRQPSSIYLGYTGQVLITNCGFYTQGFYSSSNTFSSAITLSENATTGIILSNINFSAGGVGILNNSRAITYVSGFSSSGSKTMRLDGKYIPIMDNTGYLTVTGESAPIVADYYKFTASPQERGKDVTFSYCTDNTMYAPTKILSSNRTDYVNNTAVTLGAYYFNGLNSLGEDMAAGYLAAAWANNTANVETSVLNLSVSSNGNIISLVSFDGANNNVSIPVSSNLSVKGTTTLANTSVNNLTANTATIAGNTTLANTSVNNLTITGNLLLTNININNLTANTATIAGNTTTNILKANTLSVSSLANITSNTFMPYGYKDDNIGSIYLNRTGGSSNTLWIKETSGNTGWVPVRSGQLNITKPSSGATYYIQITDDVILATGNSVIILPDPKTLASKQFTVKNITTSGTNTITINGNGNLIEFSSANLVLSTALSSVNLISDGVKWFKI